MRHFRSKPLIFLYIALPIRPNPIIPITFSRRFIAGLMVSKSYFPARTSRSHRAILRDRANARFFVDLENNLNTRVYLAGNFPMLHKMEREFALMDYCLKVTDQYKRLGSYYHKDYLLKLLELKRRKNE